VIWTSRRYEKEVSRMMAEARRLPLADQLGFIKVTLQTFPEPYRTAAEALIEKMEVIMHDNPRPRTLPWEKITAVAFGVVFLGILLTIAILIPQPSTFQSFVFRIVLALAAAGLGAVIPGFLHVQAGPFVRAGGAIALFVIVYWFNPPQLLANQEENQKKEELVSAVTEFEERLADVEQIAQQLVPLEDAAAETRQGPSVLIWRVWFGETYVQKEYQNVRWKAVLVKIRNLGVTKGYEEAYQAVTDIEEGDRPGTHQTASYLKPRLDVLRNYKQKVLDPTLDSN
jgi:hypothetical protein